MLKTILISAMAAILVIAIGFSAYNVLAGAQSDAVQTGQAAQVHTAQGAGYGVIGQASGKDASVQDSAAVQTAEQTNVGDFNAAAGIAASASNARLYAQGTGAQGTGGQGSGYRRGQSGSQGNALNGTNEPQTQNGMSGLITYTGYVSAYLSPEFTLLTADGQAILVQLGNQGYTESLGLYLQDGDQVTVTGFIDNSGAMAVTSITLDATGQTFTLREADSGRPSWAGGRFK